MSRLPVLVQAERCSIEYEEEVEVFVPVGTGEVQFKDAKRAAALARRGIALAETRAEDSAHRLSLSWRRRCLA